MTILAWLLLLAIGLQALWLLLEWLATVPPLDCDGEPCPRFRHGPDLCRDCPHRTTDTPDATEPNGSYQFRQRKADRQW
jgi:hypothetical protein